MSDLVTLHHPDLPEREISVRAVTVPTWEASGWTRDQKQKTAEKPTADESKS